MTRGHDDVGVGRQRGGSAEEARRWVQNDLKLQFGVGELLRPDLRQLDARQPEDGDLKVLAEDGGDDSVGLDQLERGELHARRQPVDALCGRHPG